MSSDSINALDATKKERQEWLVQSKREYEEYLNVIYALFGLMVEHHNTSDGDNAAKQTTGTKVNVKELIKCFQNQSGIQILHFCASETR